MIARGALAACLLMWAAPSSAQDAGVPNADAWSATELTPAVDADAAAAPDAGAGDASMAGASSASDAETRDASSPAETPLEEDGPEGRDPLPAWAVGVGGPVAPAAPPLASLPPPPRRGELDLWVQGEGPADGWHLFVRASERDRWRDVCVLPCRVSPDAGSWYVGVSMPGHREPVRARPSPIELSHHGVLSIRYHDRTVRHVAGGLMIAVGILGIVAGSAILITTVRDSWYDALRPLPLIAGVVLSSVGIGLAAAPTFLRVTWSAP